MLVPCALAAGMLAGSGAGCLDAADDADPAPYTGGCPAPAKDAYSPYAAPGAYPSGPVATLRWPGEAFDGYGELPRTVECGHGKARRGHVDVTAGCLVAVDIGGWTRGVTRATDDGAFRAIALGHDAGDPAQAVKWTDQAIAYRFHFREPHGGGSNPGFKAFARYRSEDDLYVASWRLDGVAQIQRKWCGVYTTLAARAVAPPAPRVWHRLRFAADGRRLTLELDGQRVLATDDGTFAWGTAGIRLDGVDGAYLDDWVVEAP